MRPPSPSEAPNRPNAPPDPFVASAQSAITNSAVLRDKVSTQRRPADAQAPFLTETNVRDIATTIQLGIARTPSYEDRVASSQPKNQEVLRQNIIEFFDTFLPTCLPNYEILADDQNFDNRLVTARSNSYALEPPVIRLIANTWARWTVDYDLDPTALAKHIGNLKMAKADP